MTSVALRRTRQFGYGVRAAPKAHWILIFVSVGLLTWATAEQQSDFESRHLYIRVGFLFAAIGACYSFDDPSRSSTDSTPSPLSRRRLARAMTALVPWLICIAALLWGAARGVEPVWSLPEEARGNEMPLGRFVLEGGTLAVVGLAIASSLGKWLDDEPGKYAAPAVLVLFAGLWMIPDQSKLYAVPTDPRWSEALLWWQIALLAATVVTVWFSWDSRRRA